MKKIMKFLLYALVAVALVVAIAVAYLMFGLPNAGKTPELEVNITPAKVERGKYLAYHVMMCADCHSERDFSLFSGPPHSGTEFAGGDVFDHAMGFPGRFISSNITPFGIGEWTDGELFHLITTGVKRDGNPIFPVMPYHKFGQMDREDIEAVIAYLRTLEPVETSHATSKPDFPVNLIMRTMPKKPEFTTKPPKSDIVAYGKYMVNAAACFDCHTNFSKGKFVGPKGGGGREFQFPDGSIVRAPNLTPHQTGIKHFTEESFVQRFKMYRDSGFVLPKVKPGEFQTLMPWYMYSGMKEEDLIAIYAYLQTLEPHDNMVERYTPPPN
jgi:mono/diheme cytochrome c family protein